jgi:hypothetical protein
MQPAPSGEVLLDAIQQRFRAGEIKAAVPPSPAVVKRHQSAVSAMNAAVDEWCERHPTEGVKMDELGSRIKSTWTKHAFASDDPNAVLNDHTSLGATLGAYQGRVKQTRAAGFNAAEGIALYNSSAEIAQAKSVVDSNADLTMPHANMYVSHKLQNVAAGANELAAKVKRGRAAVPDGRVLPSSDLQTIARTTAVEDMGARAEKYRDDYRNLSRTYEDNKLVNEARLRQACATTNDPADTIATKLRETSRLTARYGGRHGLTEQDIATMTFRNEQPEARIIRCINDVEKIQERTGHRVPESIARALAIDSQKPLKKADDLVELTDNLKANLTGNANVAATVTDEEYIHFAKKHGKRAQNHIEQYADKLTQARARYRGVPQATDEVMRAASQMEGDPIENTRRMVNKIRQLNAEHAQENIPAIVVQRAVTASDDPEAHIGEFRQRRHEATQLYGNRVPANTINRLSSSDNDVVNTIGSRLKVVDGLYEKYGRLPGLSDAEVANAAAASNDPTSAVTDLYAKTLLGTLQDDSRANARQDSGPLSNEQYMVIDQVRETAERVLGSKFESESLTRRAIERATRVYSSAARNALAQGLLTDPEMLEAVINTYGEYVKRLSDAHYDDPEVVAQYNREDVIFAVGRRWAEEPELHRAARANPYNVPGAYWEEKIRTVAEARGLTIDPDIIRVFANSQTTEDARDLTQRAWYAQQERNASREGEVNRGAHRYNRARSEQSETARDFETELRQQDQRLARERMQQTYERRYAKLTHAERELLDYFTGGEYDEATEQHLREHFRTDDLRARYDWLQNYLNGSNPPSTDATSDSSNPDGDDAPASTPDSSDTSSDASAETASDGSSDAEASGTAGLDGTQETSDPFPRTTTDGADYSSFEANPRGIARQLVHITQQYPIVRLHADRDVISGITRGFSDTTQDFANGTAHLVGTLLGRVQERLEQVIGGLIESIDLTEGYLQQIAGDSEYPMAPILESDPERPIQSDADFKATIARLGREYTDLSESLQDLLQAVTLTGELSQNPLFGAASATLSLAANNLAETPALLSQVLDFIEQYEAEALESQQQAAATPHSEPQQPDNQA